MSTVTVTKPALTLRSVKLPPDVLDELQDLARCESIRRRRVVFWSELLREAAAQYIRALRNGPAAPSAR
jgi:hypothetical protein